MDLLDLEATTPLAGPLRWVTEREGGEEDFFNDYKDDLKRHVKYPVGCRREFWISE